MANFSPKDLVRKRAKAEGESIGTERKEMKHPGFEAVEKKIAGERGVSEERAGAILAASTRRASPAAKRANPNLKKVKG